MKENVKDRNYNSGTKAVENWVNDSINIYNPYNVHMDVYLDDGIIVIDNGCFYINISLNDKYFNVSPHNGCGIGYNDIDTINEIKNSIFEILEIYETNINK